MPKARSINDGSSRAASSFGLDDAFDPSELSECPLCYGSGMQVIEGKGATLCQCQRNDKTSDPFLAVRVPRRYANCHLNSFKPDSSHSSQRSALNYCIKFIDDFPAVDQGLLLMGPVGVGKTHLAVSILKGLTERGFSCLFYEFGTLLKEIQDSYNAFTQTSELAVLSPVFSTDVLVLDELGASKPTEWVRDTMSHIINTRYNDNKHTIFTTNYFDERVANEETLEERIGVRLRSRLYEMCRTIKLSGEDYRRKVHAASRI